MKSRPESPQDRPVSPASGTGTSGEGRSATTARSEPASGAFPDVRLLPDGRVAWRSPISKSNPYEWLVTITVEGQTLWARADQLPLSDAERLVPAGPLLELLPELDQLATVAGSVSEEAEVWVRSCTDRICARLDSLLGDSPESTNRQEGGND